MAPLVLLAASLTFPVTAAPAKLKTENVLLVMTDGLRWQELFSGADETLIGKLKGDDVRKRFWRETPAERRTALMPFFWEVVARQGQLYGNRERGSECDVTNPYWFSYPGYSETLCGYVDTGVNSNRATPNPNVTVFEWLNRQPKLRGRTAAFGAWDVIAAIFNPQRAGFPINAGYEPMTQGKITPGIRMLNRVKAEQPRLWGGEPFDVLTFRTALEYVKENRPRLLYLSLGETDEWAHAGRYDEYLISARRFDDYVRELWNTVQAIPQYRGKTTLILAVDHGRGDGPQWTDHNANVKGANHTWLGVLGPDTPARGEVASGPRITNAQVAATVARFLGHDYVKAQPKAAPPVAGAFRSPR